MSPAAGPSARRFAPRRWPRARPPASGVPARRARAAAACATRSSPGRRRPRCARPGASYGRAVGAEAARRRRRRWIRTAACGSGSRRLRPSAFPSRPRASSMSAAVPDALSFVPACPRVESRCATTTIVSARTAGDDRAHVPQLDAAAAGDRRRKAVDPGPQSEPRELVRHPGSGPRATTGLRANGPGSGRQLLREPVRGGVVERRLERRGRLRERTRPGDRERRGEQRRQRPRPRTPGTGAS